MRLGLTPQLEALRCYCSGWQPSQAQPDQTDSGSLVSGSSCWVYGSLRFPTWSVCRAELRADGCPSRDDRVATWGRWAGATRAADFGLQEATASSSCLPWCQRRRASWVSSVACLPSRQ